MSGESALYARIYLEGILGFEPMGFNRFKLHPSIPNKLEFITINNIKYNNQLLSINVTKEDTTIKIKINSKEYLIKNFNDIIITI